jgi:myo-inositol-1(or 4)-monophosphatase
MLPQCAGVRRWGAAALDLAYVAAGRYEGDWERGLKPWDIAAGIVLVREAGGLVEPIRPEQTLLEDCHILAANEPIFAKFATTIRTR